MRRWIFRLILFLVSLMLGTMLSIVAAWVWLIAQPSLTVTEEPAWHGRDLVEPLCRRLADDPSEVLRAPEQYHETGIILAYYHDRDDSPLLGRAAACRTGLPLLSLEGAAIEGVHTSARGIGGPIEGYSWAIPSPVGGRNGFVWFLPTRPLWPGFVVNSILFATPFWLLICGPFILRRLWRCEGVGSQAKAQGP